jgi:hypothetical protein
MQSINDLDFEGLLTLDDLEHVLPIKARFLKQLEMLVQSKKDIRKSEIYDHVQKEKMIHELTIDFGDHECSFEDLALTFVVNPPSKVFGFDCAELIEGGANIDVTIDNVEDYLGNFSSNLLFAV